MKENQCQLSTPVNSCFVPKKYDRSGRSSGTAIISFETPAEATRAKKQFDGILAKGEAFVPNIFLTHKEILTGSLGQPMSIAYEAPPSRPAKRSASAPQSLLNRIQKPPLLDRLSRDDTAVKTPATQSVFPQSL
jgi:THO complex subunit 4